MNPFFLPFQHAGHVACFSRKVSLFSFISAFIRYYICHARSQNSSIPIMEKYKGPEYCYFTTLIMDLALAAVIYHLDSVFAVHCPERKAELSAQDLRELEGR